MKSKLWKLKSKPDQPLIKELSSLINTSETTSTLLLQREINTFDEARLFFRGRVTDLHDPFEMKNMEEAVERIIDAFESGEKILIFGDYDVDGTTSVSMVYNYFKNEVGYHNIAYYIPDRYTEGYGISKQGIDYAYDNEMSLIIALDCGIKSVELVDYANSLGVDFIICDHHLPGEVIPNAYAVLNPKQKDCTYPYKELCGCGVGFKLLQAINIKLGLSTQELFGYLDLVAIATCCDIVPLTGENRILVKEGLNILNQSPRPGIKKMIELAQKSLPFNVENVVFVIGPRINAAGRIKHGKGAVELLTASAYDENLNEFAEVLQKQNSERQDIDKKITTEALLYLNDHPELLQKKSTVVFKEDWFKGVIGIVASRLIEHHYKPTIVLCESNGKATGSARSVKGFDIHDAIEQCSDLLENFGGHTFAAGLTMSLENVPLFIEKFEDVVSKSIKEESLVEEIEIDTEVELERATNEKFYQLIQQFAPFGPQNMDPVFVTKGVLAANGTRELKDNHLKLCIYHPSNPNYFVKGIGFNLGHHYANMMMNKPFDIVYNVTINEWNGEKNIEIVVKDIRFS